jgi:CRISPR/Cas system CMR subunit Cmr4 (Cas7 group RAMP superfamily)
MSYRLKIEIRSYWHPGTGRGQGSHLDATTHRNARGLPSLPGRTVKGLVRDAVCRWEAFGSFGDSDSVRPTITERLFGPAGMDGAQNWPGLLRFSDGALP